MSNYYDGLKASTMELLEKLIIIVEKYPIFEFYDKESYGKDTALYYKYPINMGLDRVRLFATQIDDVIQLTNSRHTIGFHINLNLDVATLLRIDSLYCDKYFYFKLFDMGISLVDDISGNDEFGIDVNALVREYRLNKIINE